MVDDHIHHGHRESRHGVRPDVVAEVATKAAVGTSSKEGQRTKQGATHGVHIQLQADRDQGICLRTVPRRRGETVVRVGALGPDLRPPDALLLRPSVAPDLEDRASARRTIEPAR